MKDCQKLEQQADEILLKDGRSFHQGYVKTNRPFTLSTSHSEARRYRKNQRERNRAIWDEISAAYRALPKDARVDIRDRYRKYNPTGSKVRMSWSEWLTVELDKIDGLSLQRTPAGNRPDREDRING